MNKFLQSITTDFQEVIDYIAKETIENNKLFGLDKSLMSEEEIASNIKVYESLCEEELGELYDAIIDEDRDEVLDACIDYFIVWTFMMHLEDTPLVRYLEGLEWVWNHLPDDRDPFILYTHTSDVGGLFRDLKVNHYKAINVVLESNRSKAPNVAILQEQKLHPDLICEDIEAKGRYTGLHWKHCDRSQRITFWATHDNGEPKLKFVKPPTFIDPKAGLSKCWVD